MKEHYLHPIVEALELSTETAWHAGSTEPFIKDETGQWNTFNNAF